MRLRVHLPATETQRGGSSSVPHTIHCLLDILWHQSDVLLGNGTGRALRGVMLCLVNLRVMLAV
jgi:hypothetical protein